MGRFVQGEDRRQDFLLPASLDDYVSEDNPVQVVEAFIDELDFHALGFAGATPSETGRPAYHPSTMLKIYLYGYLNKIQSSRRLERDAQRNIELMWLTGRLAPDFKTIANFRRDNGDAIRTVCSQFVVLCRQLSLFGQATVAVDGSKFKAVNNRDRNYTQHKAAKRIEQVEGSIERYLAALDRADREASDVPQARVDQIREKIAGLRGQMQFLKDMAAQVEAAPDHQVSLTDPDARSMNSSGRGTGIVGYNLQAAVDAEHHLIVAHEVVNEGNDRAQLGADGAAGASGHRCTRDHRPGRSRLHERRTSIGMRRHRDFALRAKNRHVRQNPARFIHQGRLRIRRQPGPIYLPGRGISDQGQPAFGPPWRHRQLPQPECMSELRSATSLYH